MGKSFYFSLKTFIINSLVNRKVNMCPGNLCVKTIFIFLDLCKQDRRSIDAIVVRLQWLLMSLLLQNVKQNSNMNEKWIYI